MQRISGTGTDYSKLMLNFPKQGPGKSPTLPRFPGSAVFKKG